MSEVRGVIYAVVNKVNGKRYVGQTTMDSLQRYRLHLKAAKLGTEGLLFDAIREYGEDNFELNVLHVAVGKVPLDHLEERFIGELNTRFPLGYNVQTGGRRGYQQADVTKSKLREAAIVQFDAPGAREAVAERTRAQFADPTKRARHRAAYDNPETRAKLRDQNLGTRSITDGVENRKVPHDAPLPEGWRYGMTVRVDRSSAQARGRHVRWHANRDVVDPNCAFCVDV